jgi:hypothetical protein
MVGASRESKDRSASSPYATGGGGVTFERRVAVAYLKALLAGDTAPGLDGARVARVAFQQAPGEAVDDLVVSGSRDSDSSPSLTVAIGVRRRPKFVASDPATKKLLADYIQSQAVALQAGDDREYVLVVAGPQTAASEVAQLAGIARYSVEDVFYPLVEEPGRFTKGVRGRLVHFKALILGALGQLDMPSAEADVRLATWQLLSRLTVLQLRYETPDETDWDAMLDGLKGVAREQTLEGARALRDRLEGMAGVYAPQSATLDRASIQRQLHGLIAADVRRTGVGWVALKRLEETARARIGTAIGQTSDLAGMRLARQGLADSLRSHLYDDAVLLIHGASGAGKSALTLAAVDAEISHRLGDLEAVYLNLRQLPESGLSLDAELGTPLAELLTLITSPRRLLIIDGADYLVEATATSFPSLVQAAGKADIQLIIVATDDSIGAVKAALGPTVKISPFLVPGLEDADLDAVVASYPHLQQLLAAPRSRELLRRPVIADLLVRAQTSAAALTEVDAMAQVWTALVRRNEQKDHETPDSRDNTLRLLAEHALAFVDDDEVFRQIDFRAVDALRRDGLLAPPSQAPWQRIPEFLHEQLRLYAVSQVLLSRADPVAELLAASAPRWALPAARLAAQYLLAAGDSHENPFRGRFKRLQSAFDRLAAAGYGERWSDLPTEATLPLPVSEQILGPAWDLLVSDKGAGLRRMFRLIGQRHFVGALVDSSVAEPIVLGLLDHGWPQDVNDDATRLIREWLQALVAVGAGVGNPLRVRICERIADHVARADAEAAEAARAAAEARAARTPEQVAEEEARRSRFPRLSGPVGFERRREGKPRVYQPRELTNKTVIEQLGLLGPDLGEPGEGLLRRVAEYAPWELEPAVETPLAGHALASYSPKLLIELAEAYYIEDVHPEDDDFGWNGHEEGVRDHDRSVANAPFSAPHYGPFLAMFRSDFQCGIAFLARLLNHASLCRVKGFRSWQDGADQVEANSITLSITGTPHRYVGDLNVWFWYRGGGVGPYPCMSALQALEVMTDELISAKAPLARLVELLLVDCDNLAMPAFVVGMLVRHIEAASPLLDTYLTEPEIWRMEFSRTVQEHTGMLAKRDTATGANRRKWTFREAGMALAIAADPRRAEELDAVANALEQRARTQLGLTPLEEPDMGRALQLASVAGWASSLRRSSLRMTRTDEGAYIEGIVPDDVAAILEAGREQSQLTSEAYRLSNRYDYSRQSLAGPPLIDSGELRADVDVARRILAAEDFEYDVGLQACAAIACTVIERRYLAEIDSEFEDLKWAAELLLDIAAFHASQPESEAFDFSYFAHSPDVPASRAVALLLLPDAAELMRGLNHAGDDPYEPVVNANRWAATHASLDDRMAWSRSLDRVWGAEPINLPAVGDSHEFVLYLIEHSIRGCMVGDWDVEGQLRRSEALTGPLVEALGMAEPDRIVAERLLPGIRALQHAPGTGGPDDRVSALLQTLLASYVRVRQHDEHGPQHGATDMLTVARALLVLHGSQTDAMFRFVEMVVDRTDLLDELMDGISAVAEESPALGRTAASVWPSLMEHAMNLMDIGHVPVGDGFLAARGIASLIPNPAYGNNYLVREMQGATILWINFDAVTPLVPRWLTFAGGRSECVDQLIAFLRLADIDRQVELGLPWVEKLLEADPASVARRSYLLPGWLKEVRLAAWLTVSKPIWQRVVDMLLVAGDDRVAGLAD